MISISAKLDAKKVRRALNNVQKQLKKPKPVMNKIGDLEIRKTQYRIRTSKKSPDGRMWAPWAYSTLVQRMRDGSVGRGILYKSGLLARSFKKTVKNNRLTIENTAPYAQYLQNGTPNMPRRPFLGWDQASTKQLTKRFSYWIKRGWK